MPDRSSTMIQAQNTNLDDGEAEDAGQKMNNKVTDSKLKGVLFCVYAKQMCIRNLYFEDGQASILQWFSEWWW